MLLIASHPTIGNGEVALARFGRQALTDADGGHIVGLFDLHIELGMGRDAEKNDGARAHSGQRRFVLAGV